MLTWSIPGTTYGDTFKFYIWGYLPYSPDGQTQPIFKAAIPPTPWYLRPVGGLESNWRHFLLNGQPFFGKPHGFGGMQIEKPPTPEIIWNYQTNISTAAQAFVGLQSAAKGKWDLRVQAWNDWNNLHHLGDPLHRDVAMDVPYPIGPYVESPQPPYPYCTFAMGAGSNGGDPPAGPQIYSFVDAIALKRYNGTGAQGQPDVGDYLVWDDSNLLDQNWRFNRSDGDPNGPHNYVGLVCSQTPY
jgi:hypothetical protein